MARSTGPILAIGGITLANRSLFNDEPIEPRILIGTGLAAAAFALIERGSDELAVGVAWIALVAVVLTRVDPAVPAPAESALKWWQKRSR